MAHIRRSLAGPRLKRHVLNTPPPALVNALDPKFLIRTAKIKNPGLINTANTKILKIGALTACTAPGSEARATLPMYSRT